MCTTWQLTCLCRPHPAWSCFNHPQSFLVSGRFEAAEGNDGFQVPSMLHMVFDKYDELEDGIHGIRRQSFVSQLLGYRGSRHLL